MIDNRVWKGTKECLGTRAHPVSWAPSSLPPSFPFLNSWCSKLHAGLCVGWRGCPLRMSSWIRAAMGAVLRGYLTFLTCGLTSSFPGAKRIAILNTLTHWPAVSCLLIHKTLRPYTVVTFAISIRHKILVCNCGKTTNEGKRGFACVQKIPSTLMPGGRGQFRTQSCQPMGSKPV